MSQLRETQKLRKQASESAEDQDKKAKKRETTDNFKKNSVPPRESKLKPILISSTPGNAIMGYATDDSANKKLPPLKEVNSNKNPNQDLESKVESSIIAMLESKCSELGKEAEEDKAARKQAEIENSMLKSHIVNLEKELRHLSTLMADEKSERGKVEDNLNNIRDMLNKANREIGKLKQDLIAANENCENLRRQMSAMKKERDDEARSYENEIDRLRKHLEELEEEHEEVRSKLQIKSEINNRVDHERSKAMREIETKSAVEIEAKLEKINKLISENATLSEKLSESEKLRRKLHERHVAEEEKIKSVLEKNQALEDSLTSLKKQLSDAKSLKSYNHKIYEEKIVTLNEQIERLKKENTKLKKMNVTNTPGKSTIQDDSEEPTLQPVQAKPFLFGPIDTGKY